MKNEIFTYSRLAYWQKLHGFDLLAEQREAFEQILAIAKEEQVDAVVIAGDLYDRSVPAVEAVEIFNEMMIQMNLKEHFPVLAISETMIAARV